MPKNGVWVLGWCPKHPYHCTLQAGKCVFEYLGWGCLKCATAKNGVWVLGWRPKHPDHGTLQASKVVFGYLGWWCLKYTMPKKLVFRFWGGAPNTHTTTVQQRGFWIPRMVAFELHTAKWCLGSGVAPQTPITLYPAVQQRCF